MLGFSAISQEPISTLIPNVAVVVTDLIVAMLDTLAVQLGMTSVAPVSLTLSTAAAVTLNLLDKVD